MVSSKPLIFVTGNANKLREVQQILAQGPGEPIKIDSKDLDVPELQGTTQEVAREKCRRAAEQLGGPCITEDTALCFSALKDLPGVYIKHFMAALGHDGLLRLVQGFPDPEDGSKPDTRAYALCTFAYSAGPGTEPILFEGRTDGHIVEARGDKWFGWDAMFQPNESNGQTYGEMDPAAKHKISHRYRALEKLRAHLLTLKDSV